MSNNNLSSKSASAGMFAAIIASLCCITPVFSLLAGIGGIAAAFSWMEPFRPYLIAMTVGVLGFAWYQQLKPRTAEEIACACDDDEKPSFWQSKRFLGIVTLFAVLMLAFPNYAHIFYPESDKTQVATSVDAQGQVMQADFMIKGMTCAGCESHVKHAVSALDGVQQATASYKKANAQVKYDASIVSLAQITKAINSTGYTVTDTKVNDIAEPTGVFQAADVQTIEIPVKGMTCAGCEAHITHALGKLDGVKQVQTSYANEHTIVKFDPSTVGKDQIVEAINETGYKVIEKQD